MRHSTLEENALYEDMLKRSSTPLYGPKVYMVHRESGEYSDWMYDVKGVFSTYDEAKRYVKHRLTVKCYHYVGHTASYHETKYVDTWNTNKRWFPDEQSPRIVETAMTHPVEKDANTFWAEYPDGERVWGFCGSDPTWFITEYTIDEPVE